MSKPNSEHGVKACLQDAGLRNTLLTDKFNRQQLISDMHRVGIVFHNDPNHARRDAVLDKIAEIDWSQLQGLEANLNDSDGLVHPFDA